MSARELFYYVDTASRWIMLVWVVVGHGLTTLGPVAPDQPDEVTKPLRSTGARLNAAM